MYKTFNLKIGRLLIPLFCVLAVGLPQLAHGEPAKTVGELLFLAFDKKDMKSMRKIIKERTKEVPQEVMGLVKYALGSKVSPGEQDAYFNLAGTIAQMYGEQTKDDRLLSAVQLNYQHVLELRKDADLPPAAVDKSKSELATLGKGIWRINEFELDESGALNIDIDVRDNSKEAFTPRIDLKISRQAKAIVEKNLPGIKSGKISWASMGVGLKTVLLGDEN